MMTTHHGDPWAGYPEDLRDMMIAIYECDPQWFPLDDALERLQEELTRANPEDETDVLERVFWVDRLFRDSLCNGELYDEEWKWGRPLIGRVLGRAERLMAGTWRWGYGDLEGLGPEELALHPLFLAQRLNAYLCIQAGYEEDRDEFDRRASKALEDALLGVSFVMYSHNVQALAEMEDTRDYGFYLFAQRFWTEPLALVNASAHG